MKDDHLRGRSPLQTAAREAADVSDPRGSREKADNAYHVYHVSSDLSADLRMMMGYIRSTGSAGASPIWSVRVAPEARRLKLHPLQTASKGGSAMMTLEPQDAFFVSRARRLILRQADWILNITPCQALHPVLQLDPAVIWVIAKSPNPRPRLER